MNKEMRVYLIDITKIDKDIIGLSNDKFMTIAEQQGTVYTLTSFADTFNKYDAQTKHNNIIRFIEVEIEEPVKTLYYHVYPNENNDEYKDINVYEIKLDKLVSIINIETRIENESETVILDYILNNDLPDLKYKLELI